MFANLIYKLYCLYKYIFVLYLLYMLNVTFKYFRVYSRVFFICFNSYIMIRLCNYCFILLRTGFFIPFKRRFKNKLSLLFLSPSILFFPFIIFLSRFLSLIIPSFSLCSSYLSLSLSV